MSMRVLRRRGPGFGPSPRFPVAQTSRLYLDIFPFSDGPTYYGESNADDALIADEGTWLRLWFNANPFDAIRRIWAWEPATAGTYQITFDGDGEVFGALTSFEAFVGPVTWTASSDILNTDGYYTSVSGMDLYASGPPVVAASYSGTFSAAPGQALCVTVRGTTSDGGGANLDAVQFKIYKV